MKKCIQCNIEKDLDCFALRKDTSKYRNTCKECMAKIHKQWQKNNKDIVASHYKKWIIKNRDKLKQYQRKYEETHKYRRLKEKREYYLNNKADILKRQRIYEKEKYKKDINYKLARSLRKRIRSAILDNKPSSSIKELGCSINDLKKYLESKFQPGMSWGNYGKWHIDHIKPLSKFNLSDINDFKIVCHYTNLQPLWAKDNLSKGAK